MIELGKIILFVPIIVDICFNISEFMLSAVLSKLNETPYQIFDVGH